MKVFVFIVKPNMKKSRKGDNFFLRVVESGLNFSTQVLQDNPLLAANSLLPELDQ